MWGYALSNSSSCLDVVRVHNFANGTEADLTHPNRGGCEIANSYGAGNEWFALAGRSGLWTVHEYGNFTYVDVLTGTSGGSDRFLGQIVYDNADGGGDHFTSAAGDGSTLVYSWVYLLDDKDCIDHPDCQLFVRGGGVRRIVNGRQVRIPNVPPATAVAASGTRIAIAVAPVGAPWRDLAAKGSDIELRKASSGAIVGAFTVQGRVRALGLTRREVAVFLKTATGLRIAIYNRSTHTLVRGIPVARTTAPQLSFSGRTVVFHTGRTIYAFDSRSGRLHAIAHTTRPPLGVTIEGRRVVWAENFPAGRGDARGRLMTLSLP
jgi:hypothetical protein